MNRCTPSTRSSLRHTLPSSAPCRKASIECCRMLGTFSTPSAQMWSLLRCSTSSTGSPATSVIAFRRAVHPREQRLVVRLAVVDRSQRGAGVPVAGKRRGAALPSREARPSFPTRLPPRLYVPREAHKGYLFTRCRWKKSDVKRFFQVTPRQCSCFAPIAHSSRLLPSTSDRGYRQYILRPLRYRRC